MDFRHDTLALILEVQSEAYHLALVDRRSDQQRLDALRRAGFVVVQLWDTTVWSDADEVIRLVRDGLELCRHVL